MTDRTSANIQNTNTNKNRAMLYIRFTTVYTVLNIYSTSLCDWPTRKDIPLDLAEPTPCCVAVHADESGYRTARASVHACTELARNTPQHGRASADMILPIAIGTPMIIHTAGLPHSLVLVRTGTRYLVASEDIKPAAA